MSKLSSKKTQEGINNRLQVVMRSGKYTVRTKAIGFDAISLSLSSRVQNQKIWDFVWRPFFSRCTLFGRCSSSFSRTLSLSLSLAFSFFFRKAKRSHRLCSSSSSSLLNKNSSGTKRSSKPFAPGKRNSFSSRTTFRRCENPRLNTTPCWRKPACTITPGTTWTWGRRAVGFTECRAWASWTRGTRISSKRRLGSLLKKSIRRCCLIRTKLLVHYKSIYKLMYALLLVVWVEAASGGLVSLFLSFFFLLLLLSTSDDEIFCFFSL